MLVYLELVRKNKPSRNWSEGIAIASLQSLGWANRIMVRHLILLVLCRRNCHHDDCRTSVVQHCLPLDTVTDYPSCSKISGAIASHDLQVGHDSIPPLDGAISMHEIIRYYSE